MKHVFRRTLGLLLALLFLCGSTSLMASAAAAPDITGPTSLTLAESYAATSTGVYTFTGDPAPTVTKTSGDPKITWNSSALKLDVVPGLAVGTYPITLTASNGVLPNATHNLTLTVTPATAQAVITGPTAMKLLVGYTAASTGAYTITGYPTPMVVKISGDPKITWNDATKKLDVAPGLAAGTYRVTLEAGNGYGTTSTLNFTLTVAKTIFSTNHESNILNWLLFFLGFGFIWMWF